MRLCHASRRVTDTSSGVEISSVSLGGGASGGGGSRHKARVPSDGDTGDGDGGLKEERVKNMGMFLDEKVVCDL